MRNDSRFALFDGDDGSALLLTGYRRTLLLPAGTAPESIFAEIEAAAGQGEWIVLAADYALGACFEPAIAAVQGCQSSTRPLLQAQVFAHGESLSAAATEAFIAQQLAALPEQGRVAGVADVVPALDAERYAAGVGQIRRWIADGDCYQVNFTFPLTFRVFGHPLALYARLRERQPVRYGAYLALPQQTLLSFSPELFFERRGDRVQTRPMKGTAARGATPQEDDARRLTLLASAKERAENVMIVDLLRNDLGRLAAPGQVRVDALCEAEAYPTLWQMVSTVSAKLPGVPLADLFRALFPCGSITGAPKIRAMQRITELESVPRGLYTGALGWVAPNGDCRFNVAIRTLEVAPDGTGKLGVGSGIVIDADPASEYAECLLKAGFVTGSDPGFALIETLRLEAGGCPLLTLHLQRLQASARSFGFACDVAGVQAALAAEAASHAAGVFRVRLTLAHDGSYRLATAALDNARQAPWRAVFADETLDPDDLLLRHKTTARNRYDRVLAGLAEQTDVFDAIFFNTHGELCEGARSNVFVERDGLLLTPPLSCGLLPGVMRRHLLEAGRAVECVLTEADLRAAPAIYLANALRGLMPVTLAI